jgi:uncharacterized alpha-E superfamily protein
MIGAAKPLLSRVAESVYWMSRYIERAENVARFMDVNLRLTLDAPAGMSQQWQPLIATSGDAEAFAERYGEATQESVIEFLTFDSSNPNSVLSCLKAARENARTVRDTVSSEMWEQVNQLHLMMQEQVAVERGAMSPYDLFYRLRMGCHLFQGITDSTMSHNEAWHFIRLGRKLERADKTTRILDVKYYIILPSVFAVGTPSDEIHWSAVLKSVSGFEMYRKRHGRITPARLVEFLLMDTEFPRAVRYCLWTASDSLHAITGTPRGSFRFSAEQELGRVRAEMDYAQVDQIIAGGLHEFLDTFQTKLNSIDERIFDTFFALRPVAQAGQAARQG